MTSRIRYKIGSQIIRRIAQNRKRIGAIPNYAQSSTFLLLLQSDQMGQRKLLDPFIQKLESEGKKIHTIVYFQKPKDIPSSVIPNTTFLSRKDFTLWGSPKTKNCKRLIGTNFDFVINFDMNGTMPLKSMATFSQAGCRVGYTRVKYSYLFYDLSLGKQSPNYTLKDFLTDIDRYLHRIQ